MPSNYPPPPPFYSPPHQLFLLEQGEGKGCGEGGRCKLALARPFSCPSCLPCLLVCLPCLPQVAWPCTLQPLGRHLRPRHVLPHREWSERPQALAPAPDAPSQAPLSTHHPSSLSKHPFAHGLASAARIQCEHGRQGCGGALGAHLVVSGSAGCSMLAQPGLLVPSSCKEL